MSKNRLELRRMAEAAEAAEKLEAKSTTKTTRKRKTKARKTTTRRTKDKTPAKRRMIWCIYNGSMKEEARFPYDQRDAAEDKLQALRAKATKKLYFLQPLKENLSDAVIDEPLEEETPVDDEVIAGKAAEADALDDDDDVSELDDDDDALDDDDDDVDDDEE